ncbi:MAG: hypothetical protein ACRCSK_07050 [Fusobacteriaceae bacterium]
MPKKILTLEQQINKMKTEKNIVFENINEEETAKQFLTKYNYLNITSLKYLYASGCDYDQHGNKIGHTYSHSTKFSVLREKYSELLKFESKIRESVLEYETELKVHFTIFLLNFLDNEKITFEVFLDNLYKKEFDESTGKNYLVNYSTEIKNELEKEWKRSIEKFSPNHKDWKNDYHLLVKILSFGQLVRILNLEYKNSGKNIKVYDEFKNFVRTNKFYIGKNFTALNTVHILRNAICHKESLVTFLDKGDRVGKLSVRKNAINFIYKYSQQENIGVKIKDLNLWGWIMRFEIYKFGNSVNNKFEKIKIE